MSKYRYPGAVVNGYYPFVSRVKILTKFHCNTARDCMYELTKLIYGNCTAQLDLCTADLLSATGRCNSYRVEHTARLRGVWERVTSDLLVCKIYAILNSCSQSVADGRRDHRTRLFLVQFPRAFNPRARFLQFLVDSTFVIGGT